MEGVESENQKEILERKLTQHANLSTRSLLSRVHIRRNKTHKTPNAPSHFSHLCLSLCSISRVSPSNSKDLKQKQTIWSDLRFFSSRSASDFFTLVRFLRDFVTGGADLGISF